MQGVLLHVGKQLSFVYDIADLYKVDVTVPAAFRAAKDGEKAIESRVRRNCRDLFRSTKLLERIVPDLQRVIGLTPEPARLVFHRGEEEGEATEEGMGDEPGALWSDQGARVAGGRNFAEDGEPRPGPTLAKVPIEHGDAYEEDLDWPKAASDDEEVPF